MGRVVTAAGYGVGRAGIAVVRALGRDVMGRGRHPRGCGRERDRLGGCPPPVQLAAQRLGGLAARGCSPPGGSLRSASALAWRALARAGAGQVHGVGCSGVMLRRASRRNAAVIRAGRVAVVRASAGQLPAAVGGPLDAIGAVSSPGFWPLAGGSRLAAAVASHPGRAAPAPRRARPAAPAAALRACCGEPASRTGAPGPSPPQPAGGRRPRRRSGPARAGGGGTAGHPGAWFARSPAGWAGRR